MTDHGLFTEGSHRTDEYVALDHSGDTYRSNQVVR